MQSRITRGVAINTKGEGKIPSPLFYCSIAHTHSAVGAQEPLSHHIKCYFVVLSFSCSKALMRQSIAFFVTCCITTTWARLPPKASLAPHARLNFFTSPSDGRVKNTVLLYSLLQCFHPMRFNSDFKYSVFSSICAACSVQPLSPTVFMSH